MCNYFFTAKMPVYVELFNFCNRYSNIYKPPPELEKKFFKKGKILQLCLIFNLIYAFIVFAFLMPKSSADAQFHFPLYLMKLLGLDSWFLILCYKIAVFYAIIESICVTWVVILIVIMMQNQLHVLLYELEKITKINSKPRSNKLYQKRIKRNLKYTITNYLFIRQ